MARGGRQRSSPPQNGGGPGEGHNSTARKTAIREAHEEHYDLQSQEDKLIAKYIQPIRDKKAEVKAKLKKEHGIEATEFNARQAVYRIERDAAKGENWIALELIKEQWDATPVGGGVDLVDIAEKAEAQRAKIAEEKAKATENEESL